MYKKYNLIMLGLVIWFIVIGVLLLSSCSLDPRRCPPEYFPARIPVVVEPLPIPYPAP